MTHEIKQAIKDKYGAAAVALGKESQSGRRAIAEAFGYSAEELAALPADANLGLSCGNPTAMASLKPGETVVDLGSGAGLDVFLAAQRVGPAGRAIGIDMTDAMVQRARSNAKKTGIANVEFHLAEIESLPLADNRVDCVISNCVLNLVPDKQRAFREIFRILRPGGRLAASDIALKKPLPAELANDLLAYVGCIAGAIPISQYQEWLFDAGFHEVTIVDSGADLNAYKLADNQAACCAPVTVEIGELGTTAGSCCGPSEDDRNLGQDLAALLDRYDVNEYAASVRVFALKSIFI